MAVPVPTVATRRHRRTVKTGTAVRILPNILKAPAVVQALIRNKVSSSAISSVMHEIVLSTGGDPKQLSLSYTSTERYRVEAIKLLSEQIAESWTPPAIANIHWDRKHVDASESAFFCLK